MALLYRKKKIEKYERSLKKRLLELIVYEYRDEVMKQKDAEEVAKNICIKVCAELKNVKVHTMQMGEKGRGRYCFLNELIELKLELMRGSYTGACGALSNVIQRNCISRELVRTQVVQLLEFYLPKE